MNTYEDLCNFIKIVSHGSVRHFIVHARCCLLNGISTSQNRIAPPLKYDWVFRYSFDIKLI